VGDAYQNRAGVEEFCGTEIKRKPREEEPMTLRKWMKKWGQGLPFRDGARMSELGLLAQV